MECSDGSGISSRVYNGREDGVMGSLAARGVAEGDWAGVWEAVIVDLFPGVAIRWDSSSSSPGAGLFKSTACERKFSNTGTASLIFWHRKLSTDVFVPWSTS